MKQLQHRYTFIPLENKVVLDDTFDLKRILLITNVSKNTIIYTFNSKLVGVKDWFQDFETKKTTIELEYDCSLMSPDDTLQIYIERDFAPFEPSETFMDPVSKFRVSTPENLIDTDFEYGLQSTKWETLELSNNVPSFYVSDSDLGLSFLQAVEATEGSSLITVVNAEPHNLVPGNPIDVRGLTSRTAEGKFLIKSVPTDLTFTYEANGPQTSTSNLGSIYTSITPGQFYSGSQIPFRNDIGIISDNMSPSSLTVTTPYAHGFEQDSNFYLINSIGTKRLSLIQPNLGANASDGRPIVDTAETITAAITIDSTNTETKQMRSTYFKKIAAADVNVGQSRITWANHRLRDNDTLVYIPPSGDQQIDGLERFQVYYVRNPDTNTFQLSRSYNGSIVVLSSQGSYQHGRAGFHLCYEIYYIDKFSGDWRNRLYTTNYWFGTGSGWDLASFGGWGIGATTPQYKIIFSPDGYNITSSAMTLYYTSARDSGMIMGEAGIQPTQFNFLEDYNRYISYSQFQNTNFSPSTSRFFDYWDYSASTSGFSFQPGFRRLFVMLLSLDEEADTFFVKDHGLLTGSTAQLTRTSGSNIVVSNSNTNIYNNNGFTSFGNGNYTVERVSSDRFKLSFSGNTRIAQAAGNYDLLVPRANPTRNTFFFEGHAFSNNDNVRFQLGEGGVVPGTSAGSIVFDSRIGEGTMLGAWNVLNQSMNSYISTTPGTQSIVLNGTGGTNAPINSGVATGSSLLRNFFYDRAPQLRSLYRTGLTVNPINDLYNNRQTSIEVKDAGAGSTFSNQGWSYIGTTFQQNAAVPHYSLLWGYAHPVNQDVVDFRVYSTVFSDSMSTHTINNQSYNIGGDSSWRASYTSRFGTSGSAAGYVEFSITIWNENNWTPGVSDPQFTYSNNGNNSIVFSQPSGSLNNTLWSKALHFRTIFMLTSGASYSSTQVNALANKLVTDLANNYKSPLLTANSDVLIQVINDRRFRLKNNQSFEYDLITTGAAKLEFVQQGVVGLNDGAYRVKSVPNEDKFVLELPFDSPTTSKSFNASTINNNYVIILNGHYFLPGTPVIYSNNGNTSVSGLTNGNTYYVSVLDDDIIGFSESYDDALNGQLIPITAGTGIHILNFDTINGRIAGISTVNVVNGSKKVIGNNGALFKRYFKISDTVSIKNTSVVPSKIESFTIAAIADDNNMELTEIVPFTSNETKYFLETKVYARPDGYAVHRPFDGGVEIAAGTAPYSQIMRQTRKYFRYQSGKGIQTSLAINFNPPVQFEILEGQTRVAPRSTILKNEDILYVVLKSESSDPTFRYEINEQFNPTITLIRGVSYIFNISTPGNSFRLVTQLGEGGVYDSQYELTEEDGIQNFGSDSGVITVTIPNNFEQTQIFYISESDPNMTGVINIIDDSNITYYVALGLTKYPHRLRVGSKISVSGSADETYNGDIEIFKIISDYRFEYLLPIDPQTSIPSGIIQYNLDGYSGAYVRAGMFDSQNGFFFEFDGNVLYCVRRSSTQQLSGSVTVVKKSNLIVGENTNFSGQLVNGNYIVIRGQSYKVIKIIDRNRLIIQPEYKGVSTTNVILTKTVDTKVPQQEWSLDPADGTGSSGFKLNINKIQMAYMDYSWYGAGKIRFGFKDNKGHVKYFHEFIHNNVMDEAYMRSGNMVARYEIENDANPTYAPTLFHWGTSVIMDGRFDDDKAYLFTASSKPLSFTNGATVTATANSNSQLIGRYNNQSRSTDWYVRMFFPIADAPKFSNGIKLFTNSSILRGQEVAYTLISGSSILVHIFIQNSNFQPAVFPSVPAGTVVSIGLDPLAILGANTINLGTDIIPLITIRLAPSVDSSLSGALGARDIINRMQLQLNEVGLILTNDCEVKLILNGDLSTVQWEQVASPSLSELLRHESGDKVIGGTEIFSFRASGGGTDNTGVRLSATSNFPLTDIVDLGNSILGGDGTYPNGPDILTIAVKVVDTQGINAISPFRASSRITWSESQA